MQIDGARGLCRRSPTVWEQLAEASQYTTRNRLALRAFLADVRIPPDNNRSERSIRIVNLGRKNVLFVQSEDAGNNVAIV